MGKKNRGTKAKPSNQPLPIVGREYRERMNLERQKSEEKQTLERRRSKTKKTLKAVLATPEGAEAFYNAHPHLRPKTLQKRCY